MANFNEAVNNNSGLFYVSESLLINRVETINEFKRAIAGWMDEYFDPSSSLYKSKSRLATMPSCFRYKKVDDMDELIECSSPRELFILYKKQHRSKKLAGRCFVWDVMEAAYCGLSGQELQKKSYRVSTVVNGFGVPRFDGVKGAVLITEREVVVYGGAMIVAAEMDIEKVRFDVCFDDMCVSYFDTYTAAFDRSFGLKENFPEQYDEFFGSAKSDDKFDHDYEYFVERVRSMKMFERKIHDDLYLLTNAYRMCIQYKTTHRDKKMAGRCFMWDCASGTSNRVEVRRLDGEEDCEGLVVPRFDGMAAAIFIAEKHVYMYGDAELVAMHSRSVGKYVLCNTYLCGLFAGQVKIPSKMFY